MFARPAIAVFVILILGAMGTVLNYNSAQLSPAVPTPIGQAKPPAAAPVVQAGTSSRNAVSPADDQWLIRVLNDVEDVPPEPSSQVGSQPRIPDQGTVSASEENWLLKVLNGE